MRLRVAAKTAVGLTALTLLALPACSTGTAGAKPSTTSPSQAGKSAGADQNSDPQSSAALQTRLLDESELDSDYLRQPSVRPSTTT
jgi:hypothetical protein